MKITSDWHIHSDNSCDGACMRVADLVTGTAEKGITDFGLTDHLHTPFNLPDIPASRKEFLASHPSVRFHFGIEVSCVSEWEIREIASGKYGEPTYGLRSGGTPNGALAIGISEKEIAEFGIEYVVAGTHWPLYIPMEREAVIRDYQRQNMFLATHPLVDIVAHPWWWMGHWKDKDGMYRTEPWFDDFTCIPKSMHDEFAHAAVECGTCVEINIEAMLLNAGYPDRFKRQYVEYLAALKSQGAQLSIGSDCHNAQYDIDFEAAARMLESVGIRNEDLWVLPPRAGG